MRTATLLLPFLLLPATSAPAQTIRVDAQLVLLDALVQNKKTGLTVDTLSAKDFRLTEDGVSQTITYFSRDQLPLSVVLLFDMTETVHAALGPLAKAGLEVLGHLNPEDEVAVMIFSSRTELLQGFTTKFCKISLQLTPEWVRDHPELRKQGVAVLARSGYYR
jgi:VWFA-related protein